MKKPNLLFIYTDEQAYKTMAAYGNPHIEMPNLDGLALVSTLYERAYVTQPVCTPSRSTLLTGQWPHTNGCTANNVPLSVDTRCIPEMLRDPEYVSAHFGKWHLGDEIFRQHGFDEWCSIDDGYREYYSPGRSRDIKSDYYHFLMSHGFGPDAGDIFARGETARFPEEYSKPAFLADQAARFLRKNRDNPFLLFINFFEPHMPYFGPRDGQYPVSDIPLPPNFEHPPRKDQPLKTRVYREAYFENGHSGLPLRTKADWKRLIANYWGLCSLVDTYIGKILTALTDLGLYDDTIIVFTSDHGDMMASHQLTAKCVMFEEAVRVPLIIKNAGQSAGGSVHVPVSQIDLVPTILKLLCGEIHEQCQGRSLMDTTHRDVFIEWQGPNSGIVWEGEERGPSIPKSMRYEVGSRTLAEHILDPVRTIITPDGWKLNYSTLGEHELYNLQDDPDELHNLAVTGTYGGVFDDLSERIRRWQVDSGDSLLSDSLPEGDGRTG